jgi:formiminotetrahydrofolate cyclodeaminase
VVSSELVGLIPRQALLDAAEYYLQIEDFQPGMVLESHLEEPDTTPEAFLDTVAEGTPTPGGGSVSALAGALAAALASMVCHLTLNKEPSAQGPTEILERAQALRRELAGLVEQDALAYQGVLEAYRQPKGTAKEKKQRTAAIQEALEGAARVPLEAAKAAVEVLELLPRLLETGLPSAASDVGVAAYMAQAAVRGAGLNVRTNLSSLDEKGLAESLEQELVSLDVRASELMGKVERGLAGKI